MTKNFKLVMALILSIMMVLGSMSALAAAATDTGSITINNQGKITSTHTYEAYQVFKGNLSADGKTLSDIQWGTGVVSDALLTELKTVTAYAACTDAASVAKVLEGFANDSSELKAFNDIVAKHLSTTKATGTTSTGIQNLAYGYYFVKDVTTMPADGSDATSAYIIQLIGQVTLNIKADAPELTKKIVVGSEKLDTSNGAIGDTVTYEIKTKVPDIDDFRAYYFNITDKLSKGLTYTPDSLSVTIGGTAYALASGELTVGQYDATNGTQIDIDFKRLYTQYKDANNTQVVKGAEIVVTYSATINEDAIIGSTGNPNEARLTYTNDANWDGNGTPGGPDFPVGVTPWDKTITYVTKIEITKVITGTTTPLEGAVFQITGTTLNKVIIEGEVFTADDNADPAYYKLKDGSYTTTESTAATADLYVAGLQKYKKEAKKTISAVPGQTVIYEGVSDSTGKVSFTGLPAGDYVITEIAAPAGYNKIEGTINVHIDWTKPTKADDPGIDNVADTCTWEYTTTGHLTNAKATAEGGIIKYTIENSQGATLPSTGGIGTTIFYVAGSILVLAAAILLITKRRMGAND